MAADKYGECQDCGSPLMWRATKNGVWLAYNLKPEERDGTMQFITHGCQQKKTRDSVKVVRAIKAGVKLTKRDGEDTKA